MKKLIASILLAVSINASASVTCDVAEYYDPSQGLVIKAEYCYDLENDDSETIKTVLETRLPKKGETGYKG